ncbi:hypothetical protein JCGZ_10799 [Jatropha curcas]|uniref:Uncharacterized protein n=1 Tax=Jatropha curcas TaxID=180498 RepID=A0A067KGQ6_JATCU|nr:hypothetical protein JCGZ_10799 [Jatropha curcas]
MAIAAVGMVVMTSKGRNVELVVAMIVGNAEVELEGGDVNGTEIDGMLVATCKDKMVKLVAIMTIRNNGNRNEEVG